jgi:2-dehydropantoate 2-reductase
MDGNFQRIAVVGAGAVGSFYGILLARAGQRVVLIGRPAHVAALSQNGLELHRSGRVETVHVEASTELSAVRDADLVLLCVKSNDTETAARALAPHLAPDALVLSLQNGVDNPAAIARHVTQPVIASVVYVAVALPKPGVVEHYGRGELVIGPLAGASALDTALRKRLEQVVACFARAQVPVRISSDVMTELWSKLLVNCAYNAISALAQAPYGRMVEQAPIRALQEAVVREVVAVAAAEGIDLPLPAALEATERIARTMSSQLSSTAQDLARGKPSEIDHLNGTIVRLGERHGVATPANQALYALVKLVEATRS